MVPGIEDLLPPPPKKGTSQEGELLPPPPKKKMEDGTGIGASIGGTVGTSNLQSELPKIKEEFYENLLDPSVEINNRRKTNTVFTKSGVLGNVEIKDEDIPANILDKQGYRRALQGRLLTQTPDDIDLQVIATTTNKPVEAIEAYAKGRDGKGVMIEFDTIKKTKADELNSLVIKANADLGLTDSFEAVFATPETASLYIDKVENAYQQKAATDAENYSTPRKKEVFLDEAMAGRGLAYIQKGMDDITKAAQKNVSKIKSIISQDILSKIENDNTLTYDQKVKKAGNLVFGRELNNISEAESKRFVKDSFGANDILNQFGKLFRDEDEETKNLNSINAIVETKLNSEISKQIIYEKAALSETLQEAMDKANAGTLTEEDKINYQEKVNTLKANIEEKQKEYKSPQVLQKEYPTLLKQSVIADINEFNAIKSGNIKGYGEAGYENITLKEHLKAQGYDMSSQVVKDAIKDAELGVGVKDYSFFGDPVGQIHDVFFNSAKSIGDIVGIRDDVTLLSEKKAGELYPTTIGVNDELQLTTGAATAQNIINTTGQVIGQGLMQAGTAGLGRMAGLTKVAAANAGFWSSGALTSYDQAYKDSFDFIDSNIGRNTYAGLIALSNAASEKIFPESKLITIPGVKDAVAELASKMGTEGFTDKLANQLLTKAKNEFLDYGKKYATNIGKETLEETATSLFESGARMLFGDPNMDVNKAITDAKNTAIQTAIGTLLIGGMGAHKDVQAEKNIAPVSVIYNAAVYKDEAMDALTIGFKQGLYDEVEFNNKVSLLNTAEVSLSELGKAEKVIGRELSRPQKELFVANSTAQKLLTEQKKEVDNTAIEAKIDEKLKNLQSQQMQLLDNKVQFDEFGNVVEVVVEKPIAESKETKTEVSEAATIINSLEGNDQIPAFELEGMKSDPETALQNIADQALGFGRVDGVRQPLAGEATQPQLEATEKKYGKEVVDKAIAMFPAEKIEVTETVTEQPEVAPEVKIPTNKKERLAAFKNKYVEPTPTEKKQWNELSMGEKLALAKENLPQVDNLTNTEAVKVADQNDKMLLGKLNKQPKEVVTPTPTEVKGKEVEDIIDLKSAKENGFDFKFDEDVTIFGDKAIKVTVYDKKLGSFDSATYRLEDGNKKYDKKEVKASLEAWALKRLNEVHSENKLLKNEKENNQKASQEDNEKGDDKNRVIEKTSNIGNKNDVDQSLSTKGKDEGSSISVVEEKSFDDFLNSQTETKKELYTREGKKSYLQKSQENDTIYKNQTIKIDDLDKSAMLNVAIEDIKNGDVAVSKDLPLVSYEDGKYKIVDGRHRIAQSVMDGKKEIQVNIEDATDYTRNKLKEKFDTDQSLSPSKGKEAENNIEGSQNGISEESEAEVKSKAKDLADRIRKGKIDEDISMVGVPFAKQVWNAAVEVVAKSVELTGNLADAIEKGIAYIKSTDWYKGLSKENRQRAEERFREGNTLTEEETEDIKKNLSDRIQNIDHVYVGKSAYSATDTFAEQGYEQLGRKPQGRVTTIGAMIQARLDFLNQLNEETEGDAVKTLMDYFGFDKHNKKGAKSIPLKGLSNEGSYAMVNTLFAYINRTPLSELNITPAQSAAYSKYLQKLSSELGRKLGQELNTGKIRNILSYTETDNIMGSVLTEPQRLTIREAENLMNDIRSGEHKISDEDLADAEEGSLEYETELEKQAEQSRTLAEIIGLKKQQTVSKSQSEKIIKRIGKVVKETEEKIKDLINKINCA